MWGMAQSRVLAGCLPADCSPRLLAITSCACVTLVYPWVIVPAQFGSGSCPRLQSVGLLLCLLLIPELILSLSLSLSIYLYRFTNISLKKFMNMLIYHWKNYEDAWVVILIYMATFYGLLLQTIWFNMHSDHVLLACLEVLLKLMMHLCLTCSRKCWGKLIVSALFCRAQFLSPGSYDVEHWHCKSRQGIHVRPSMKNWIHGQPILSNSPISSMFLLNVLRIVCKLNVVAVIYPSL